MIDKILKILRWLFFKLFIFPAMVVVSPLFVILAADEGHRKAIKETKELLVATWKAEL